ncbi:hypothetical protein WN944_009315 [Citrus x changshan-huyou]|uniref:non-specific serine/threonine protein kinase n=1 Tax=Citrus x changshan-huyou TaxID=2935761 RepID=A0AAP0MPN0_9ROSI
MNNIYGSIPPGIGGSSKLQVLDLSSNHIVDKIPVQLEKLFSLNKLILNLNKLSGGVPLEFGSLTKLEYLDLSANKLSSSIPKCIGNLSKLYYLNLSNNQFSHKIPTEFEKLIHLSELDLSHNIRQEEIPPQVCNMESLEKLNLSHNNLSGFIPRCFEEMRGLSWIDISYNELQGPIPNSTVFKDGLMEGNKGLCGNFEALPSCDAFTSHKQTSRKKWVVIVFPILGVIVFFIGLIGLFFFLRQRKKDSQEEQTNYVNRLRLLSVLNFDGKIMHEEIIKATDDFDEKFCIGKGGQGSVYKAELPSGDIVAVKKFNSQLISGNMADQDEFLNEVLALNEIRHRNIVKFHGFCSNTRHSFLVCEYLHRGSLARILDNNATAKELSWNRRINVIKGVANALSYLHHDCLPSIIHRDISSKNVLLDSEFEAHVSDFGIAKFVEPHSSNWTGFAGTFGYAAPEIAYTMRATEKYNVYSFGVLVFEVIKGNHPRDFFSINFSSFSNMIVEVNQILDPRLPTPSPGLVDKLISIMEVAILCLDESPEARPTMEEGFGHHTAYYAETLAAILAIEAAGNFKSLSALGLHINQLNGFIPHSIGNLSSLRTLYLYSNALYGFVPEKDQILEELESKKHRQLVEATYLNLSNNQFGHKIPIELEKLIHLLELDMSYNFLGEAIPFQICNMKSLEKLNLCHNNLSGFIPRFFEGMHSLSRIDISYNKLQGPIPNSTTFKGAQMKGNKRLCGNVKGLSSWRSSDNARNQSNNRGAFCKVETL